MVLSNTALDGLLAVSCVFSALVAIVYLFYSNRILAVLIGYAIRLSWWNEESSRAWVSLESFQVSLLAGKIMIKELKYCTSNQTFRAIKCTVTWRYWLWRTRGKVNRHIKEWENKDDTKFSALPCRIQITLEGVEWLLYNRTASYNNILANLQNRANRSPDVANASQALNLNSTLTSTGEDLPSKQGMASGTAHSDQPSLSGRNALSSLFKRIWNEPFTWVATFQPNIHEILPIGITAQHGAIVCGNGSTPSLLVAKFSSAEGSYAILPARSSCDPYKTVIDFKFQVVKVDLERNSRYRGSLVQQGRVVSKRLGPDQGDSKLTFSAFFRFWDGLTSHETQRKVEDAYARMQARISQGVSDYAIVETILEAPELELSYYWDELGIVPAEGQRVKVAGSELREIGNGALAPQYGMDLIVHAGTARYGPWADRQRVELQRLFFPPTYQDLKPTAFLKPGDRRMYTELRVFVELRGTTTFHIPFKEPSKDWEYDESRPQGLSRKRREGGWLEIRAAGNSTITYIMPWVTTVNVYDTLAELHLHDITTLSSVNDIRILTAESSTIQCELPVPLGWNEPRSWIFDISLRKPTFYVIRDHINLFTDLGKDWSSGPPADFDRWIPMHYMVNFSWQEYELNLFLNDHNIITHPHTRDANTLISLRGATLNSQVDLPLLVFRPEHTTIPFWLEAPNVDFRLTLPKWNTHAIFSTSRTTDFAHATLMRLDASFLYHSETRPGLIDQLKLDGLCRNVVFMSFGWVIRHLMVVRDNYFGNFTNFSTLSEYVDKRNRNLPVGDPVESKWREGKSNVFEATLGVRFEDSVIVIPAGIPGYEYSLDQSMEAQETPEPEPKGLGTCVIIRQPELQLYLRNHDYSMEMSLNISPVVISVAEDVMHSLSYHSCVALGRQKLFIDGINILANRLFGPQPRISTYLCLWEIQVGAISGVVSTIELRGLAAAMAAFRFNFSDVVNAPAKEFVPSMDPDVTFLKVTLNSADVAWVADNTSIYIELPRGVNLDYNNLPGKGYNKLVEVRIRQGSIRALMSFAPLKSSWLEAGSISYDVIMDIYTSPENGRDVAGAQLKFVAIQDVLTQRASFLYKDPSTVVNSWRSSAYQASMYLPRPHIPQQTSVGTASSAQPHNSIPRKSRNRVAIDIIRRPDSDEDEHISAAERDARLAYSRPETPLMFNRDYDSRSMSSSDESDDDGITTDMSDSDSDGPEDNESNNDETTSLPLVSRYRHIVRRFEARFEDQSASQFNLVRDIHPVDETPLKTMPRLAVTDFDQEISSSRPKHDFGSTIRLFRSSLVDVLLTPLCLHVLRKFSEELHGKRSMEMMADSLTTAYVNDALSEKNASLALNTLDIEVSTFRLRVLQNIIAVEETRESFTHISSPSFNARLGTSRMLSDTTMSLHDLGMTLAKADNMAGIRSPTSGSTFRGSFSRLSAGLSASVIHRNTPMSRPRKTTHCTVVLEESMAAHTAGNVYLTLGDAQLRLHENSSPAVVVATADALTRVVRMSKMTYQSDAGRYKDRKHSLIWEIILSSRNLNVGDPLAQIQPSLLVQVGAPLRLRLDASWKLFMYLRHCLRHLSPSSRRGLEEQCQRPNSTKMDQLYHVLTAQLLEWGNELDLEEVKGLHFLKYCFGKQEGPADAARRSIPSVSFHSGTCILAITQRLPSVEDGLENKIAFGPLHITYSSRKQSTVFPVQNSSGYIPVQPSSGPDSSKTSHRHILTVVMDSVALEIHPTFIEFLQHLQLHRIYGTPASSNLSLSPPLANHSPIVSARNEYLEIFVKIQKVSIQAAVESMILEGGLENAEFVITILQAKVNSRSNLKKQRETSANCFLKLSQLYTRVRQSQDKANPFQPNIRDILTSLTLSSITFHSNGRILGELPPMIRGVFTLGGVLVNVPRSALLTYRLVEEWRTQYLPNIHSMMHSLLVDLDKPKGAASSPQMTQSSNQRASFNVDLQISAKHVGASLHVMHGTWFFWDVHDIMVLLRDTSGTRPNAGLTVGLQLASQILRIGARSIEEGGKGKTVKINLPAFRSFGSYDGIHLRSHAIIDHFSLSLKPRYMDDILAVQQNLGTHFYDMLDLVAETRKNRPAPKKAATVAIKYNVAFMLQGFRVGIVGPTTTLDLTSTQMTGTARNDNGLAWNFAVSNLALALSHHSAKHRPRAEFDRNLRSAYMVLDLNASSSPEPSLSPTMSSLRLQVGRMHAVMSPNSIGELGDLVDYIQAEMLLRKEQRAHELEEIKNKTKRVMRTFKVERAGVSLKRSTSVLDNRTVILSIADIGIAFPSGGKDGLEVDAIGSVPAFLMSIQKAAFFMRRHESGQASMGRLSFQFVEQFDQSHPSQFDGDKHRSRNKLLYPGIKAEFQSGISKRWQIEARVGGFVLDLDPSIVDNVFGLMDVYRKGKERIERLTAVPGTSRFASEDTPAASIEASYQAIRTSNIFITLVFQSGKLRLRDINHGIIKSRLPTGPESLHSSRRQTLTSELDHEYADVIHFPKITVWGEYRATPAVSKLPLSQDQGPSILIFRSQVHTTINQINPTIFPFLTGFTQKIEERLRIPKVEHFVSEGSSSDLSESSISDGREFLAQGVFAGMQLSFSLSIDSSRLELVCGHNLGVVAALHWESGGFVTTLSPRTRVAYFAGSVHGLQVGLRHVKHQGGMVQAAHMDARNLVFSVSYCQIQDENSRLSHSVSVVVDTEFGASLRLDRLQDLLIFKAVYIDRLPGTVPQPPATPVSPSDEIQNHTQSFTTLVLFRARHIKLMADLGHTVAAAVVDLESLVINTRITEVLTTASLSIARTSFDLEEDRALTGYMRLPNFEFATVRRNDIQLQLVDGASKMLDVTLTSGELDIVLQSEKRTILQYHAKPFAIQIADDWTAIDWNLSPEERTLRLDFSVEGTEALAIASLQTIPKIITLLARLRSDVDTQKADARNSLAMSSITQLPKPKNTLLEVADAMIRSAQSKSSDTSTFSYVIVQHMTLSLSDLRFALFKNPHDTEMAMFQGRDVNAELQRVIQGLDTPPTRILKLAFSALNLSRYSYLKYKPGEDDLTATLWLERLLKGTTESTIARVPQMHLEMNSDIEYDGEQEILLYDLVATADDHAEQSQGIYVSLNLSLYIWAGALVKGLGVEIEKALVTSGFNKPGARGATAAVSSAPALRAPGEDAQKGKSSEIKNPTLAPTAPSTPTIVSRLTPSPLPATPGPLKVHELETHHPRKYQARSETQIDYGTIQQLGEATPDAKAPWLGLKETVPPRVHEYATLPMEVLMKLLLEVYSKRLQMATKNSFTQAPGGSGGQLHEGDASLLD